MPREYEPTDRSEVREILESSWEQLVTQFDELLSGPASGAANDRTVRFAELEHQLRGHMRIVDDLMLRPFELHDSGEASALRAEHHELGRLLDEAAGEIERSIATGPRGQALVRLLRNHSKRKLMRLFPWVDSRLRQHAKVRIVDRIRALTPGRRSMVEIVNLSELDEPLASAWA